MKHEMPNPIEKIDDESSKHRKEHFEKMIDFLDKIHAEKVFDSDESKREFISNLNLDEFMDLMKRVNGILRSKATNDRELNSTVMMIGSGEKKFPHPKDKNELYSEMFKSLKKMNEDGRSMDDIATLLSTSVTEIHAFKNGNGRTSRVVHSLFKYNYSDIKESGYLEGVLTDQGIGSIDTGSEPFIDSLNHETFEDSKQVCSELQGDAVGNKYGQIPGRGIFDFKNKLSEESVSIFREIEHEHDNTDGINAYLQVLHNEKWLSDCFDFVDGEVSGVLVDMKKIAENVSDKQVKEIETRYWEIKKENTIRMMDMIVHPEDHVAYEHPGKKVLDDNGEQITALQHVKNEIEKRMTSELKSKLPK